MAYGAILGQSFETSPVLDNYFTKDETLTSSTAALFGLGADSVPDDAFAYLGKYASKIATGSYVGTYKYGPDNPNSLTFDFEPKFVLIFSGGDNNSVYFGFAFLTSEGGYSYKPAGSNGQWFYVGKITPSFGTNKVTWSAGSAETQMNSGFSYYYVAIG